MSIHAAIAIAIIAAAGFNIGTALQKSAATRLPKLRFPPKARTLGSFFISPRWVGAFCLTVASWIAYLFAAGNAPISVVQPILGLGLAVLALFSVFYLNERLSAGEWLGVAILIAGIALLGASAEAGELRGLESISYLRLILLCILLLLLVAAAWIIERSRPGFFNIELVLGAASGVLVGIAALLTRVMLLERKAGNTSLFVCILLLVIALNMTGLFIQQGGFQRGRALTVTAVLAVLNKLVAIGGGFFALGETLPEDPLRSMLRIAAFVMLICGTYLLSRFSAKKVEQE